MVCAVHTQRTLWSTFRENVRTLLANRRFRKNWRKQEHYVLKNGKHVFSHQHRICVRHNGPSSMPSHHSFCQRISVQNIFSFRGCPSVSLLPDRGGVAMGHQLLDRTFHYHVLRLHIRYVHCICYLSAENATECDKKRRRRKQFDHQRVFDEKSWGWRR